MALVLNLYDTTPFSSIITNSPGSISLTNSAPIVSNAHVSDDNTNVPSSFFPRQSGLIPCASRIPTNLLLMIITNANDPVILESILLIDSSIPYLEFFPNNFNISSVSDVL